MPSAPASATRNASSSVWMPLTMSGPFQDSRSARRSSISTVGSNMWLASSSIVESQEENAANFRGSVVRKLIHQLGCIAPSTKVLRDSEGGIEKPLRLSRSRAPATGTSTVMTSASYPARATRSRISSLAARSFHT